MESTVKCPFECSYYFADQAGAAIAARTPLVQDAARREISNLAVWSVTSAKPGNGVELLRDGRDDTYWQSDGTQPHLVNIQFQRKMRHGRQAILTAIAMPT